jgi:serine/threonine-protein kinase
MAQHGESTCPYQPSDALAAEPAARIKMALVSASATQPTSDTLTVLRKRLRAITLIYLVAFALYLPMEFFSYEPSPELIWFVLAPCIIMLAGGAVLTAILWSKRQLSLARLRLCELIAFGVLTVGFGWTHYHSVRIWLPIYAARGPIDVAILATFASHVWFVLIVCYGAFIPNSWRRCAAVVAVMALIPLTLDAVAGLSSEAVPGRLLGHFLMLSSFLMSVAVALAVFGSHDIQVLRQQASAARKLGQYLLKKRIGSGGMGEVYLAEHVLLRRPCALKLIRPERAGDPNMLRRFEREVQATATLTHANTVQIFDYGHAEDGTFYYVMEYLPGLSLEQLVSEHGPLQAARAVHLLRQVCGALREAHAIGLIHHDIKPSNILLCERGGCHDVAKLLDFGLVRAQAVGTGDEKLTQEGAIPGTPAYMSPEQAGGQDNLDAPSDIYSLGAVAYFLLTGRPPFADRSSMKVVAAHMYEPGAPLTEHRPDICVELQAVVMRCLAKQPADRFADAESLEMALAACQGAGDWSEKQAGEWWRKEGVYPT